MSFHELHLSDFILSKLKNKNFTEPTPIQNQVIPILLQKQDIIACAKTGSGKTLAYLIPIINQILDIKKKENTSIQKNPLALILSPTRELAVQIYEEAKYLLEGTSLSSCSVYGGQDLLKQKKLLLKKPEIIIGTPGRILDFMQRKDLFLKSVEFVIIDEADKMLDMGFIDDVKKIVKETSQKRTLSLFSATYNMKAFYSMSEYMNHPEEILINPELVDHEKIKQELIHLGNNEKMGYLISFLKSVNLSPVIIFTNTKRFVNTITHTLNKNGIASEGLSSDFTQNKRLAVLNGFRNKKFGVLTATDVASRGLDIDDIKLVINYDIPQDPETYVHRIGRTARAGKEGYALSFCSEVDYQELIKLENYLKYKLPIVKPDANLLQTAHISSRTNGSKIRQETKSKTHFHKKQFKSEVKYRQQDKKTNRHKNIHKKTNQISYNEIKEKKSEEIYKIVGVQTVKLSFFQKIFSIFSKKKKKENKTQISEKTLRYLKEEAENSEKFRKKN
ncbi:MAG: DEAD/DEAH box helicase [Spirochaetia bacterium]|nr:DEAD/DEAH box helicase [Spirochaetia bacterium]